MRRYRSYKFTDKHHSRGGIHSSIAAAVALLCTVIDVYSAFAAKGNGERYLVLFGFVAMISCGYGAYVGKKSFEEEECYHLFSGIGTVCNLILLVFWIAVFGLGYFV